MRKSLIVALLVITIGLTAVLSIANMQSVTVNYLFGTFQLPLILLLLASVVIGMLLQFLLGFFKNMSLRNEIKNLKVHQKNLENHIQGESTTDENS